MESHLDQERCRALFLHIILMLAATGHPLTMTNPTLRRTRWPVRVHADRERPISRVVGQNTPREVSAPPEVKEKEERRHLRTVMMESPEERASTTPVWPTTDNSQPLKQPCQNTLSKETDMLDWKRSHFCEALHGLVTVSAQALLRQRSLTLES